MTDPARPDPVLPHPVPPDPVPPDPARPGSPARRPAPAEVERHERALAADRRTERRMGRRELGCLVFVAVAVLVRERYLR